MPKQPPDVPKNMRNYFLGLLLQGERWSTDDTPANRDLQRQHLAFNRRMSEQGTYLVFGPLLDNGAIRGIAIIAAASAEEVAAIMGADPAVQAGRFAFEVHPAFLPALDGVAVEY